MQAGHAPAIRETFEQARSWTLLQTCMLALALLDDQPSAARIEEVLVSRKQPEVRTAAAMAFALLRQWSALPALIGILRQERSIVTLTSISQVMGFLSSERAVEPLVAVYRDKHLQPQARAFYERLGYAEFGRLDDYPTGHLRHFMRKDLR